MNIRIHPAERPEAYEDLLLALLTQANLPAMIGELTASTENRPA